jgi:ribosomal protein S18 acetylase RimI-like enzyme
LTPEAEGALRAIQLKRMGEDEFRTYQTAAVRDYAGDKVRTGDWAERDAPALSLQAFQRFAPDGMQTPGQHFFTVHDSTTDAKVGWLWYQVRDDGHNRSAYLCDLVIFDGFRRQGYGTACLAALDDEARGLGLWRVGLHVFAHNPAAAALYKRCGYEVTNLAMAKNLALPADRSDEGPSLPASDMATRRKEEG